jgi:hypothetical protein
MSTTATTVKQKMLLVEPDPMQSKLISLLINGVDVFCVDRAQTDSVLTMRLKHLKRQIERIH